ncbi:hypothetical protein SVIOM342S_02728 [Streptomyces violaceorubidus]
MYPPMQLDEGVDYYLKPMNCPMHNLIFDARGRSYRELPLRLFEFGTVYRYEKSGVVHGLNRARGFTQDDAHIYCTREQMSEELDKTLTFVLNLLRDYGLNDFYLELSTKDPEKFVGSDEAWEKATETLRQVAEKQNLELVADPGGAAFYGPKISVQAKDAIGRTWQMSTIQLDFNLPERFDLEYTAADGSKTCRVMIHRALFGSIERFFAVLLEHYAARCRPGSLRCRRWASGGGRARAVPRGVRGGGTAQGAARRRGLLLGPDAEEDPHAAEAEGPVHDHRRRRGHARGHGVVPLPRRIAGERHSARPGAGEARRRGGAPDSGVIRSAHAGIGPRGKLPGAFSVSGADAICCTHDE